MNRKQGVQVECSECNTWTDAEYLVCITCLDDVKKQLKEAEDELANQNRAYDGLAEELDEVREQLDYYKKLVAGCTTCGAKNTAQQL